jgi:dUTP pyrophosphatase
MYNQPITMYEQSEETTNQNIRDELYTNQFYKYKTISDYAVLKLYVRDDLLNLYEPHVKSHNDTLDDTAYPNAGFDLYIPEETVFDTAFDTKYINLGVKCDMIFCKKNMSHILSYADGEEPDDQIPIGISYKTGFYMYPRSSMSKTPLLLANHVGIIDSGYRGDLIAAVRSFEEGYTIKSNTRLFQICHPTLCPVYVVIVPESELGSTERGSGGFGSTGIN